MNVPTITATKEEAEAKILAYRRRLKRAASEEYEQTLKAYEATAKGKALIDLPSAFKQAGAFEDGRPKLAIARSDRKQVRLEGMSEYSRVDMPLEFYSDSGHHHEWRVRNEFSGLYRKVAWMRPAKQHFPKGYALVPMVPADVREVCPSPLKDLFTLFEVEAWADRSFVAESPRDPLLLRHLAGDLYVIEAAWDLTEIERAIMSGRREN